MTAAAAVWFWRRRESRIIVTEVGATYTGHLMRPLGAPYRIDLVAVVGRETHVIEVKGTRADLAREDLGSGKWTAPFPGLRRWLCVDEACLPVTNLPTDWGLMSVDGHRLTVVGNPPPAIDERQRDHLEVLSSILCLQSLPRLMGLDVAEQVARASECLDKPWRQWTHFPAPRTEERDGFL